MESINIFGLIGKCITSELFRTKIHYIYNLNKISDIILDVNDKRIIELNNMYEILYSKHDNKYIENIGSIIQNILTSNNNKSIILEHNNESLRSLYKNINELLLSSDLNESPNKYMISNIINNLGIIDKNSDNDNDIINN